MFNVHLTLIDSTIADCIVEGGREPGIGGAVRLFGAANEHHGRATMSGSHITGNRASHEGGGLSSAGLPCTLTTTLVQGNHAPIGANIWLITGTLSYRLPTVAGYWLPNAMCVVNREGCGTTDQPCQDTRVACSLASGNMSNSWRPSVPYNAHTEEAGELQPGGMFRCKPPILIQPCDWNTSACANGDPDACLLGESIFVAPFLPIDATFPYPCPPGRVGSADSTSQTSADCGGLCPAGAYCPYEATVTPVPCERGSYCPLGSLLPRPCHNGTFGNRSNLTSASECTVVPPGFFAPAGSDRPIACPVGYIAPAARSGQCVPCAPGSFQNVAGRHECKPCPLGSYCPAGSPDPIGCENGAGISNAVTLIVRASSPSDCQCKPDYYNSASDESANLNCTACPYGTDCRWSSGATLTTLPVKRGYYRLHTDSVDVRRCPDAAVNCVKASECQESNSGCSGTAGGQNDSSTFGGRRRLQAGNTTLPGESGCYNDLTGVFCRLCAPRDDGVLVYYVAATTSHRAHCQECRQTARDSILLFCGYLGLAAMSALLLFCMYRACLSKRRKLQLHSAWRSFTPHHKIKILIGLYMIVYFVPDVYEVEMPPTVKSMLSTFAVSESFGFDGVMSVLQCLQMPHYTHLLAAYMVIPLVLALVVFVVALGRMINTCNCTAFGALLEMALPLCLKLAWSVFPLVTNLAFDAFACYEFTESTWLKVDVSIQCYTDQHDEAIALAWVALLVYPIGTLALNAALLYAARHAILNNKPTPLSVAIAFLHREFEPQYFWWELVEMLRRFVLVGVMVLAQGSMMQLILGTLLSGGFLLYQVQASPYAEPSDDFLAAASSFALLAVFLCSIAFKEHELTGLPEIEREMSIEQADYYVVDQRLLTVVMLASVLGSITLSFVLFLIQLAVEGRRLRREAHASKARRLRYKESNEDVQVPEIAEGDFHVFLSHVWGTGQDQMRIVKQRLLEMVPDMRVFLDVDGECLPPSAFIPQWPGLNPRARTPSYGSDSFSTPAFTCLSCTVQISRTLTTWRVTSIARTQFSFFVPKATFTQRTAWSSCARQWPRPRPSLPSWSPTSRVVV